MARCVATEPAPLTGLRDTNGGLVSPLYLSGKGKPGVEAEVESALRSARWFSGLNS
jgi:hypothetical protein